MNLVNLPANNEIHLFLLINRPISKQMQLATISIFIIVYY